LVVLVVAIALFLRSKARARRFDVPTMPMMQHELTPNDNAAAGGGDDDGALLVNSNPPDDEYDGNFPENEYDDNQNGTYPENEYDDHRLGPKTCTQCGVVNPAKFCQTCGQKN